jgi:hypothetical protein
MAAFDAAGFIVIILGGVYHHLFVGGSDAVRLSWSGDPQWRWQWVLSIYKQMYEFLKYDMPRVIGVFFLSGIYRRK